MLQRILFSIIAVMAVALVTVIKSCQNEREEKERFQSNQTALLSQVDYWTTESGESAAEVRKLTLTVDELRSVNSKLKETAEDLGIKLSRIQSASTTSTSSDLHIITEVRDSIIYRDSIIMPVETFRWRDPWTEIVGVISKDSVDLSLSSTDTLTTIAHKIPHKFWFIKWGCKSIEQTVISSNPHTRIIYSEHIEIK